MTRDPENLADVLDEWLLSRMEGIHTCIPGQIETYSESDRKARVKPMIKMKTYRNTVLDIPPIDNVPVIFPSSSAFSLTWPLKRGDGVLILFSEIGMGNYLNSNGVVVEAEDSVRFSMGNAIAIPGLFSFRSIPDSAAKIEIDNLGNISLNGDSKKFVTHTELNTALQTFMTALNLHIHTVASFEPSTPPTVSMSLDISSASTTTIKTGG